MSAVNARLLYHLASGRIIHSEVILMEERGMVDSAGALRDLQEAMIQPATRSGETDTLVPLLKVTDYQGRRHLIVTANLESVELVLAD